MAPPDGSRTVRQGSSRFDGPHRVADVGTADIVVRYVCHSCGSSVEVEFPTKQNWAAVRAWLVRHPGTLSLPAQRPA